MELNRTATHRVALLTGSNCNEREEILHRAERLIDKKVGHVERSSSIHSTRAWGFECRELFANQALVAETTLSPEELLLATQSIEQELGRDRQAEAAERASTGQPYASRVVDVDIIFYDDAIISTKRLTLPHPLMHEREFVLSPLCEIAPTWQHPLKRASVKELLNRLNEKNIEQ